MGQSNRDRHKQKVAAQQKRGVASGYRGSYYGSDGYDSVLDDDPAMPDETATIAAETDAARCGDISPDPPTQ